jgi:predicted nucleic acid-binding protein
MRVLDASSIIHAWDEYPLQKFSKLWHWLAEEIATAELRIPSVAFDEVAIMSPECADWLTAAGISKVEMTEQILQVALAYKGLINVVDDNYHPKGVDENDLLIIASARVHNAELVTNEARQPGAAPQIAAKRKIPAICQMPEVDVVSMNFREYFMSSPVKF